jgi:hypothetical protein
MNSRLIRVLIVVIGVAIGAAASYLLKDLETRIDLQQSSADSLRERANALSTTIGEARTGQVAYVARGQGEAFWMTHVAGLLPALQKQSGDFAASLTAPTAQAAFETAAAALENFGTLDSRVKEFVAGGNSLLAADLIFADGLESAATASTQTAVALKEELQARARAVSQLRSTRLTILGGAAGGMLFLMLLLAATGPAARSDTESQAATPPVEPVRFEAPLPRAKAAITPKLITTAQLCGDLARITESRQLPALLERAAKVLEASGIITWVADSDGHELRPAMSYGYSDQVIGKMGSISRDAANAVAAAYRAAELRTVAGDTFSSGALIAPLMTADGCIGVLSAELKSGSEKDESFQALATIFAAQLATLVSPPAMAAPARAAAQA